MKSSKNYSPSNTIPLKDTNASAESIIYLKTISGILAKGFNVEIRLAPNGEWKIYELRIHHSN